MATTIKVDEIVGLAGNSIEIPSGQTFTNLGTATGFGGGGILQVKQALKLDTESAASTVTLDVTGLQVAITPASTANKIFIMSVGNQYGNDGLIQVIRGSTLIHLPTAAGSRTLSHSGGCHRQNHDLCHWNINLLDAPATTSEITYKIRFRNGPGGGATGYINRPFTDSDDIDGERAVSSITVMEIASTAL